MTVLIDNVSYKQIDCVADASGIYQTRVLAKEWLICSNAAECQEVCVCEMINVIFEEFAVSIGRMNRLNMC